MLTNTLPLHATTGPTRRRLYRLRFAVQPSATAARARRCRAGPAAPRGPVGTARARQCRVRLAGPRAPGGAARQELRRCNSVVVGALRPRQRLEALECLHCLGSPLVDEGSSWKSPATKNKLSAAKQQSKPHASINRMVSFPQALSMTSSMDACAALSLTSSMDADKDKEQPHTDNTCAAADLACFMMCFVGWRLGCLGSPLVDVGSHRQSKIN